MWVKLPRVRGGLKAEVSALNGRSHARLDGIKHGTKRVGTHERVLCVMLTRSLADVAGLRQVRIKRSQTVAGASWLPP